MLSRNQTHSHPDNTPSSTLPPSLATQKVFLMDRGAFPSTRPSSTHQSPWTGGLSPTFPTPCTPFSRPPHTSHTHTYLPHPSHTSLNISQSLGHGQQTHRGHTARLVDLTRANFDRTSPKNPLFSYKKCFFCVSARFLSLLNLQHYQIKSQTPFPTSWGSRQSLRKTYSRVLNLLSCDCDELRDHR